MIDLTKIAQLVMMRKALILVIEVAALFIAACAILAACLKTVSMLTEIAQETLRIYGTQPPLLQLILLLLFVTMALRFVATHYYSFRSYVLLFFAMQEANRLYAAAYASRRAY